MGFVAVCKFTDNTLTFKQRKQHLKRLIYFSSGVPVLFALYIISITFIRTGELFGIANFSYMLSFMTLFYGYGFFMLRMPYYHPWIVVALIYLIALSVVAIHFVVILFKKITLSKYHVQLLFLAVLGVGLFSYYQGRSHALNFNNVMGYSLFVLAVLVSNAQLFFPMTLNQELEKKEKINIFDLYIPKVSVFLVVFLLFLQPFGVFLNPDTMLDSIDYRRTTHLTNIHDDNWFEYVLPLIEDEDEIIILTHRESYVATRIGRFSTIGRASHIEMLRMEHLENLLNDLRINTSRMVLVDLGASSLLLHTGAIVFSPAYTLVWGSESFMLLKPNTIIRQAMQVSINSAFERFSTHDEEIASFILTENIYDIGMPQPMFNSRGEWALQKGSSFGARVAFPDEFTIMMLFNPSTQEYHAATLIDNHFAFAGFTLFNEADNFYRFAYGNGHQWIRSDAFFVEPYTSHYLHVSFGKPYIHVYLNGQLVSQTLFQGYMAQPFMNTTIGNRMAGDRRFMGDIFEVFVTRNMFNSDEVQEINNYVINR